MMRKNKGITLIALVVTIIILLILAGVSITMFGNNGLFAKAQLGGEKYNAAQQVENSTIESLIDGYDREEGKIQVVPPKIEVVGETQEVYGDSVQIKITVVNPSVIKEAHYFVEGATAQGDTKFTNEKTITITEPGRTTVKAYSVSWNDEKTENASLSVVVSHGPPAEAEITVAGETSVAALPQTLRATITQSSDNGIAISECEYTINSTSAKLGTNPSSYDHHFTENGETIDVPVNSTGNEYIHVLSVDKAGEKTETIKTISASEVRHTHSGNSSACSGCYTKKGWKGTKTTQVYHAAVPEQKANCGGTWIVTHGAATLRDGVYYYSGSSRCNKCGKTWTTGWAPLSSFPQGTHNEQITVRAAQAEYWETTATDTNASGEGNRPSNTTVGTTRYLYSNLSDKWYMNCGKENNQIVGYTIAY